MPPLKGFCGPTGVERSPFVACDRLINFYLQEASNQKGVYSLLSMPGLRPVATLPSGPVRGLYISTVGRVFAATSTSLYEVFAGWSFLARGTIPTGTTPVSFTDDGRHVVMSAQGTGLAYELATDTLTTIAPGDPALTFGQLAYLDGRILTNQPGTRFFWYSDILNATSWPALNFYAAEGRPDPLVTLYVDHREMWLFGSQSTEIWYSTGDALSPFARNQSVFLEQGIETPWSVDATDNTVFWLGGTARGEGPAWTARGYSPVRISTHAMESAMAGMLTVGDCVTWAARHGGHAWVVYDFPSGGQTWAFDTATSAWMELVALAEDGSFLPYPCNQHCSAFGEHLFGHRATGELFVWDPDYHMYGTGPRLCRRTAPHVRAEQKRLRHKEFRLECEMGVGLDGNQMPGSDPKIMLSYSDDGGRSWSQGRWRSAGRIGARQQQAVWYQLGMSRQRAYEITITDPVKIALLGAYLEVG